MWSKCFPIFQSIVKAFCQVFWTWHYRLKLFPKNTSRHCFQCYCLYWVSPIWQRSDVTTWFPTKSQWISFADAIAPFAWYEIILTYYVLLSLCCKIICVPGYGVWLRLFCCCIYMYVLLKHCFCCPLGQDALEPENMISFSLLPSSIKETGWFWLI